jgi:hypothetical protein
MENKKNRVYFYGWNNLTEFEKKNIQDFKIYLTDVLKLKIPIDFSDRDLLKFLHADSYNLNKAGVNLSDHFFWLT